MGLLGSGPPPTLSIETEEGQFFVLKMTGHEHLGQMYEYIVELAQVDEELQLAVLELMDHPLLERLAILDDQRFRNADDQRVASSFDRGCHETSSLGRLGRQ